MNAFQRIVAALTFAIAITCAVSAQQSPRDIAASPVNGSAAIRGALIADTVDHRPVRRALITIAGAALRSERAALTNDDGTFAFERLPAGRYTLVATKAAWAPSYFGSTRPGRGPGTPVAIADGQRMSVSMKMLPGATISGVVRDYTGQPRSSQVRLLESRIVNGVQTLVSIASTYASNSGYRFFGLAPGTYAIAARNSAPPDLDGHYLQSAAEIDAQLRDIAAGRAMSAGPPTLHTIVPGVAIGLAPTFFPHTVDPVQAATIVLAAGEDREGIDIALQTVPTADLTGIVVDQQGGVPPGLQLTLISPAQVTGFASSIATPPAVATRDGKFARQGLTPGHYTLFARAAEGTSKALTLWAETELVIDGHDVPNFTLTLQRGLRVAGHVAFDAKTLTPPRDLTTLQMTLTAVAARGLNLTVPPAQMASDGTFAFEGVPPGRYRVAAKMPGAGGWVLDAATLGSADVLDSGLTVVAESDVHDLSVTLTDHPAVLSGVLQDNLKRPAPEYAVIAFPTDRQFWTAGSRRVVTQRPAHDGTFIVSGLPAGEYFVAALTDLEGVDLTDVAALEAIAAVAVKVPLVKGETRPLTLEIRGGGAGGDRFEIDQH